uniref:Uncharacterized protein n=1 Tax=Stegastes partitus TaxID=144197 RepID=A0A3B4ZRW0_9TELE
MSRAAVQETNFKQAVKRDGGNAAGTGQLAVTDSAVNSVFYEELCEDNVRESVKANLG